MNAMTRFRGLFAATAMLGAALLTGCASNPTQSNVLEQARANVQTLSADPLAATVASKQLDDARKELKQAEDAAANHESRQRVEHLAYIASRTAQTGLSATAEARARERVAQAEAERNRVLLESREREVTAAKSEVTAAKSEATAAKSEAEAARTQAAVSQSEALAANVEAERAAEVARTQAAEAQAARAENERLMRAFGELQAKQTPRGMVLTLGNVLFDTGKATLKPGANLTLDRLAAFMTEMSGIRIMIEGHTDSVGSDESNQILSERRARAVADALQARDIPSSRIEVYGRGEAYPVASNDTSAGQQQNRRVEVLFSDLEGNFNQAATAAIN